MMAVLLALLVVGALAFLAIRWPGWRRRSSQAVTLPLPRGPHHLHYCTQCDRQWEHLGASHECTRAWAASCPVCAAQPESNPAR
jgi:hypothetical protein